MHDQMPGLCPGGHRLTDTAITERHEEGGSAEGHWTTCLCWDRTVPTQWCARFGPTSNRRGPESLLGQGLGPQAVGSELSL